MGVGWGMLSQLHVFEGYIVSLLSNTHTHTHTHIHTHTHTHTHRAVVASTKAVNCQHSEPTG